MPKLNEFFPSLINRVQYPNILPGSGSSQITSSLPFVEYDSVTLYSNRAFIESAQEEVVTIRLDSYLPELVIGDHTEDRWFNSKAQLETARLRIVMCLDTPNAPQMDFISQRFNEYQNGLLPQMLSYTGSSDFIAELVSGSDARTKALLSPGGPFDADNLTRFFYAAQDSTLVYEENNILRDVVIKDFPIGELLRRNKDGSPMILETNQLSTIGNIQANLNKVLLNPIYLNIGYDQDYTKKSLQHLSIYSFVYVDYNRFQENLRIKAPPQPGQDQNIIKSGIGNINAATFIGNKDLYEQQIKGSPLAPYVVASQIVDKISVSKLQDARKFQITTLDNVEDLLYRTFEEELGLDNVDKPLIDIISNKNYFSPLWITKCDGDSARYCFSFDKLAFLSENSLFPWLYKNPATATDLLDIQDGSGERYPPGILNVKMKKRRVYHQGYREVNNLGTTARVKEYEASAVDPVQVVADPVHLSDVFLPSTPGDEQRIEFFEGYDIYQDDFKSQTMARYQYEATMYVVDPAANYLRDSAISLRSAHKRILEIYDIIINSPPSEERSKRPDGYISDGVGLYDLAANLRLVPLSGFLVGHLSAEEALLSQIKIYTSYFEKFLVATKEISEVTQKMLLALVRNPNPEGILKVAEVVDNLARPIERILETLLPKDPYGEGTLKTSRLGQLGINDRGMIILEASHYFDELFNFGEKYKIGYNHLSTRESGDIPNDDGMPTFSKSFLDHRVQEEFNKYFGFYTADNTPSQKANPISPTYANSSYQYFTPKTIKTYGKSAVNQPDYRNNRQNVVNYNIDRYAELLSDLITTKRATDYLTTPFYFLQDEEGSTAAELYKSLSNELSFQSCQVEEGFAEEFSVPTKTEVFTPVIRIKDAGKPGLKNGSPLIGSIMGGSDAKVAKFDSFVLKVNKPLSPLATGSFGVKETPEISEKEEDYRSIKAKPPVKFVFNILGELTLRSSNQDYESEMFNSMINQAFSIGMTQQSAKTMLEGDLSYLPNQLKSMYVIATCQEQQQLGEGFDAVRVSLDDNDVSTSNRMISAIKQGVDYPPYTATKDPMKIYAKFITFWMNYKQIAVLEYLAGFEDISQSSFQDSYSAPYYNSPLFRSKRKLPIWKKFTHAEYLSNYDKAFLCRWRDLSEKDVNQIGDNGLKINLSHRELFDLPVYNRYFLLRGNTNG